jgi:hypothetical protein
LSHRLEQQQRHTQLNKSFIQLMAPLLPLKLMAQSRRGVIQILEAQVHPLVVAIARFIQLMALLPLLIPLTLTAAKAPLVE